MSRLIKILNLALAGAAFTGLVAACGSKEDQKTPYVKHERDFANTYRASKPTTGTAIGSRSVEITDQMELIYRQVKNPLCLITAYGGVTEVVKGKDEFSLKFMYTRITITPREVKCPETPANDAGECVKNVAECSQAEQVLKDYLKRPLEAKLPLVNKSSETLLVLAPLGS